MPTKPWMPTKMIEKQLSSALQLAGRAFLSAVFVTSELLIHAELTARSVGSWLTGAGALPARPVAAQRRAITDRRRTLTSRATKLATKRARRATRTRSVAC